MKLSLFIKKACSSVVAFAICLSLVAAPVLAQEPPPTFTTDQLDQIVSRIALYPDPLLAQILTAATFPDQIPDAAKWADEHHNLTGEELANAIQQDQLPWDPSVQALLPFPSVLDMMASDMVWTSDLGNAVLADRDAAIDAISIRGDGARCASGGIHTRFSSTTFDGAAVGPIGACMCTLSGYTPL